MRKRYPVMRLWFLGCLLAAAPACVSWADTTILILRHGEKPAAGLGQLSCQGLQRALLLPRALARFGAPGAVFAPNPAVPKVDGGIAYHYVRPLATIEPYAIRAGLPVDLSYDMRETRALAQRLLQGQGLQVVAWEHHLAVDLAREILRQGGGDPSLVPVWANDDFDSIYVLRVAQGDAGVPTRGTVFTHDNEGLNGQTGDCP